MTKKSSTIPSTSLSFEDTKIAFASKDNFQLKKSYWIFATMNQNWLVNLGTFFIKLFLFLHFPIKKLIKTTIFQQFCGGESIADYENTIRGLNKVSIGTILDYSVEGKTSDEDFDQTVNIIIQTIERGKTDKNIPFAVFKVTGIGRFDLLEKASKKDYQFSDQQKNKCLLLNVLTIYISKNRTANRAVKQCV